MPPRFIGSLGLVPFALAWIPQSRETVRAGVDLAYSLFPRRHI